jgi:hypothetical protein
MDSNLSSKVVDKYVCKYCDYNTSRYTDYVKHLTTDKHKKRETDSEMVVNDSNLSSKVAHYECKCGKKYKYDSGYYRHKKKCTVINTILHSSYTDADSDTDSDKNTNNSNEIFELKEFMKYLMKENSELKNMMIEQQNIVLEIAKNGTTNTNNSHNNTNSHNKAFNLQFFLNETCKDAMNISEFVESIQFQLSDLERVGEIGYVEGISNIIVNNLNKLDITKRPVHCTDKKRETMYIKDENIWEKDEQQKKLRKFIKKVADKNARLLPKFTEKYPDYKNYYSTDSDKYSKIIVESMGGSGNNDLEKEDKIIRNIAKNVVVEKDSG